MLKTFTWTALAVIVISTLGLPALSAEACCPSAPCCTEGAACC